MGFRSPLLQHLPKPGFLLIFRKDEAGVHANRKTLLVSTLLALFPVGASDVAAVVVLANVPRIFHVGLKRKTLFCFEFKLQPAGIGR